MLSYRALKMEYLKNVIFLTHTLLKMFTLNPMPQSWRMVQCALCAHKKYPFTNNIQAAAKNNVKVNCGDQKAYIQQETHKDETKQTNNKVSINDLTA